MNRQFRAWAERWRRAMRNRRTLRELDALSPAERRHIAEDVGFSGADLRRFICTHEGPSELMPRRLELLGLDPAYVMHAEPATYRDLERVCAMCKSSRRCAEALAKGDVQTGMDNYCLNAFTIDSLLVERPKATAG